MYAQIERRKNTKVVNSIAQNKYANGQKKLIGDNNQSGKIIQMYWGESYVTATKEYVGSATWDGITTSLSTMVSSLGSMLGEGWLGPIGVLAKAVADIGKYSMDWYRKSSPNDNESYREMMTAKYKVITAVGAAIAAGSALYIALQQPEPGESESAEELRLERSGYVNGAMIALNLMLKHIMGLIEEKSKRWEFLGDGNESSQV